MTGLNKVILIGNLGTNAVIDRLPSGQLKATLSVGVTKRGFTSQDGRTIPDQTSWFRVIFWNKPAEICERYAKKGKQVYIEGELCNHQWTDRNGQKQGSTDILGHVIQLLGKLSDDGGKSKSDAQQKESMTPNKAQQDAVASAFSDDKWERVEDNGFGDEQEPF